MLRIKGRIGDWPVDLSVDMDSEDWARLAAQMTPRPGLERTAQAAPAPVDALWQAAQQLLHKAGSMDGPQLLAELEALAGSATAGKRLLVRLRHCPLVRMENGVDAPIYHWQDA
jgi:hypothetical protein